MKNSTRIILFLFLFGSLSSLAKSKQGNQTFTGRAAAKLNNSPLNISNSINAFYMEDFASGIPSGWQTIDSSGNGVNWKYTTTGTYVGNVSLDTTGNTAANGYMIYDSDSAQQSVGGENADLISDAIDCSGKPTVILNFNEYLTHYNDTATVWVSNDGANWVEVHNSSSGLAQFSSTPNPNNVDIDITSIAANQATVYIRFNYRADFSFYWMIDDVQLYELPTTDVAVTSIIAPLTTCNLLTSTEPVTINLYNEGSGDINGGINVTMIADNGAPVTETISDTITVGSDLLYTFTATADFSVPGEHTLTVYATLAGDSNTTNDTVVSRIFNGPHVVDYLNSYSTGFEPSDDVSGYLVEDANNDSVSWVLSTSFPHTGTTSASISGVTADDWYFTTCLDLDSSIAYKLTYYSRTSTTSTQALLDIYYGSVQSSGGMTDVISPAAYVTNVPYTLETVIFTPSASGTYYIGFHVAQADSLVGFWLDDINIIPDSAGVGIKKTDAIGVNMFPNPTSGEIYLNSPATSSNGFKVEVYSPVGQLVSSQSTDQLSNFKIDLQNQPSGIYVVRIFSDKGITSRHVSVTH